MFKRFLISAALLTTACNTASPGFRGTDPVQTDVGAFRFQIRQSNNMAEVIRTNFVPGPRYKEVEAEAKIAITKVTGCKAGWIEGDAALMIAGLSCNGAPAPDKPKRKPKLLCDVFNTYTGRNSGYSAYEVECDLG